MNEEIEIYKSYIKEIQKYALLGVKEEEELSRRIEAGDQAAFRRLVNCNLRLVVSVARKFSVSHKFSVMDLIQEGNLGLMSAARKYHYSFNTRFSTYAYTWIFQYMRRFVHNKTSIIDIPHRKEEMLRQISSLQAAFNQKNGRDANVDELASMLGLGRDEVADALACS